MLLFIHICFDVAKLNLVFSKVKISANFEYFLLVTSSYYLHRKFLYVLYRYLNNDLLINIIELITNRFYMNYSWRGSGSDTKGVRWDFTLDLDIDANGKMAGSFDWVTSEEDMYGIEFVRGTVDDDGCFEMDGTSTSRAKNLVLCSYRGRFYNNYGRIEGSWKGDCPSGNFSGR